MGVEVVAGTPTPFADPLAQALGYVNWNMPFAAPSGPTTLTSGTIYVAGVWLPPNKVVTNLHLQVQTAASGTAPTGFFVGLASASKMLAQSGNLASSAQLTSIGTATLALSASYTTSLADSLAGNYYVLILLNGSFGSTAPQFERTAFGAGDGSPLSGKDPLFGVAGTSQTALPANAAAVTIAQTTTAYWGVACS